ncbi:hypothetical protein [Staphylococcus capitis]|uniref:hypothetical protein n=1 Tax=Staphylococcus capitis TaxID=29388 RepID=UPI0030BBE7E4
MDYDTIEVKVKDIVLDKIPNFPNAIRLKAEYHNIFDNKLTKISVKLTETINANSVVFKENKLNDAFEQLNQYIDHDLKVPNKINIDTVSEELKPLIDKEITVYREEYINEDRETGEKQSRVVYTLKPVEIKEYIKSNSSINQFLEMHPELKSKSFLVKPVGFSLEKNNGYFNRNKFVQVETINATKTRLGLAKYIYKHILYKDKTKKGELIRKDLSDYMNNNKNEDGIFEGTTSGILKSIGAFTHNSVNARGLGKETVSELNELVNERSGKGRANIATFRLIFSLENEPEYKYKTRRLKEAMYQLDGEILAATINPDDTNYMEFAKFTEPLYSIGALSSDVDLEEIKQLKEWYEITDKLIEIMNRENVFARIEISSVNGNKTFNLIGLEKK